MNTILLNENKILTAQIKKYKEMLNVDQIVDNESVNIEPTIEMEQESTIEMKLEPIIERELEPYPFEHEHVSLSYLPDVEDVFRELVIDNVIDVCKHCKNDLKLLACPRCRNEC